MNPSHLDAAVQAIYALTGSKPHLTFDGVNGTQASWTACIPTFTCSGEPSAEDAVFALLAAVSRQGKK